MISVEGVAVELSGSTLFDNVNFVINQQDRIAIMGKNGAGKSTLLKIIANENKPTRGKVSVPKDKKIAYLPQHIKTDNHRSVFEEAYQAFAEVVNMEKEINDINQQLETRTDYESEAYTKLIERVSELGEQFYLIENTNYDEQIELILKGLGFNREDFTRQTSEFSGGWRMRIELAKILLQQPDLILLDEPTNHMDIESIQWLEQFLINSGKAVIIISHDRAFVDNITSRTIEISMKKIYDYKVNYSQYLELRVERREQQVRQYNDQQKIIQDNQTFIDRFKGTYSKVNQVNSRIKMLEKMEIVEIDQEDTSSLRLKFPNAPKSGKYPVSVAELGKNYGDHIVFTDANFVIERGETVALVGKNGEGKSTLVKSIMSEIDFNGTLEIGHNVKIGYFAQNQASLLDENMTIFETVDNVAEGSIRTQIKNILGAFMFSGDDINKKVGVLSGGEKTRLAMIKLLLEPVNLLILDEPTNHLDMRTKDILKDALKAFEGTIILVSHDRDFLSGLAEKVYEFGNKRIKEHIGDINEFIKNKKIANLQEIEK